MKLNLKGLDQFKATGLLESQENSTVGKPIQVNLDLIDFDEEQPRRGMREKELDELAESIRQHGVLEPVSLRENPLVPGRYIINRGERRCRASRIAKIQSIPSFIDNKIDRFAQAVENLHREDLSPFDLAIFIAARESEGFSRSEIARRLNKQPSWVTEAAQLIGAPIEIKAVFDSGRARDTRVLYMLTRSLKENHEAIKALMAANGPITRDDVDSALAGLGAHKKASDGIQVGSQESGLAVEGENNQASLHRVESHTMGAPTEKKIRGDDISLETATSANARKKRLSNAFLVEHEGRHAYLLFQAQLGKRKAEIHFEDGEKKVVKLSTLKILEWTIKEAI